MSRAVDEDHRDELGVLVGQARVVFDGSDPVGDSALGAYLRDHGFGLFAQVAAGSADDLHAGRVGWHLVGWHYDILPTEAGCVRTLPA